MSTTEISLMNVTKIEIGPINEKRSYRTIYVTDTNDHMTEIVCFGKLGLGFKPASKDALEIKELVE